MKKKITKFIESILPRLYDEDGEAINRRYIADKIYDSIPNIEKLDIQPFETWIPFACSLCPVYNQAHKLGCTYTMFSEKYHKENPAPKNCPLNHNCYRN